MLAVDDENFASDFLDELRLLREVFSDVTLRTAPASIESFEPDYDRMFHRRKLEGVLPSGLFGSGERSSHLDKLEMWRANSSLLGFSQGSPLNRRRIGRADEFADVDEVRDSLHLAIELDDGETLDVELYGETGLFAAERAETGRPGSMYLLAGYKRRDSHLLHGFFDYLALAASGELHAPDGFDFVRNPQRTLDPERRGKTYDPQTYRTRFGPLDPDRARAYLQQLVADMVSTAARLFDAV